MIHEILVPLDGSALGETVLPCAEELARLTGAGVALVQIVEPFDPLRDLLPARVAEIEHAQQKAEAHVHDYLATVARQFGRAGVAVQIRVAVGDPADQIIQAAGNADLIAMSTHGHSGVGRWGLGSVAGTVLRDAPVPVLLLRADQTDIIATGHPRRILVPLDGSDLAEQALPLATGLARRAGATLLLLRSVAWPPVGGAGRLRHGEEQARGYLAEVGQRLTRQGCAVGTSLRCDPAAEAILAAAMEQRADLIVMTTHGRGGLGRWAYGSVADRVLRGASVPVLLVRAAAPPTPG